MMSGSPTLRNPFCASAAPSAGSLFFLRVHGHVGASFRDVWGNSTQFLTAEFFSQIVPFVFSSDFAVPPQARFPPMFKSVIFAPALTIPLLRPGLIVPPAPFFSDSLFSPTLSAPASFRYRAAGWRRCKMRPDFDCSDLLSPWILQTPSPRPGKLASLRNRHGQRKRFFSVGVFSVLRVFLFFPIIWIAFFSVLWRPPSSRKQRARSRFFPLVLPGFQPLRF